MKEGNTRKMKQTYEFLDESKVQYQKIEKKLAQAWKSSNGVQALHDV